MSAGVDVMFAADMLRRGGLIGLPTETVYGLAADAVNVEAVTRVFTTKGRPAGHPLIVHVADLESARSWASEWPDSADALGARFWPGPLTLVVPRARHVLDVVTGGRDTVALRVPAHPMARRLLLEFGGGVVAPSANLFGRVSPTTAAHVEADLGSAVDYVLDGGACDIGVESTIVDCSVKMPQVLRPGAITEDDVVSTVGAVARVSGPSRAPGMLSSHYAPSCEVVLVATMTDAESFRDDHTEILDGSRDPRRFAHDLYAEMRRCENAGRRRIVVVMPADRGIGHAIHDRLKKASGPRD